MQNVHRLRSLIVAAIATFAAGNALDNTLELADVTALRGGFVGSGNGVVTLTTGESAGTLPTGEIVGRVPGLVFRF